MKLTKIKQQIKRTDRFSIFLDDKYAFSISEAELIELNLKIGQEIEKKDLQKISEDVEFGNAKNSCYRLLSYRARSIGEIRDYLIRKKYSNEIIDKTIDYLTIKGLLNDEQFAKQWVESRVTNKNSSIIQLKSELRQKKINSEIINKVLEEKSIDEVEQIKELIIKKRTQPKYQDDLKLMQFLARRGFKYDKILVALGRRAE